MVVRRSGKALEHRRFEGLSGCLRPGDVLVLNDTRVVRARLPGVKETGGKIELLVLEPFSVPEQAGGDLYRCLVKAAKPPRRHSLINLKAGLQAVIVTPPEAGQARVRFLTSEPIAAILERAGEVPLPPYIHRNGTGPHPDDADCYQTVYAREAGSIAAPTAGLHFTAELLHQLRERGVEVVTVTLHVGYGTFAPMRAKDIREHRMHPEYAEIPPASAELIAQAKKQGRRIVVVGTTSARVLEWAALKYGTITGFSGYCNLFIYPGFQFRVVDALLTNFHLPKSTLLLLVAALAGRTTILDAYREAVRQKYRFYSYGDAMLIL